VNFTLRSDRLQTAWLLLAIHCIVFDLQNYLFSCKVESWAQDNGVVPDAPRDTPLQVCWMMASAV
jgi:hypothetical protein